MDKFTLHWLAGLLEGEGYFWARPPRKVKESWAAYIGVQMTDRDVVERAATAMQTKVKSRPDQRKPHHKPCWRCQLEGPRAINLMRDLLPLMGERRAERIRSILAKYEIPNPYARAPKGFPAMAKCHPDRQRITVGGLCQTCYMQQYRMGVRLRNEPPRPWTPKRTTKRSLK